MHCWLLLKGVQSRPSVFSVVLPLSMGAGLLVWLSLGAWLGLGQVGVVLEHPLEAVRYLVPHASAGSRPFAGEFISASLALSLGVLLGLTTATPALEPGRVNPRACWGPRA